MNAAPGRIARLLVFLLLVASVPAFAQEEKGNRYGIGKTEKDNYGKTPDEIAPYKGFRKPNKMYFQDEQPFLGTGRDKKPPKDLKSVKIGVLAPLDESSPEAVLGRRMLRGAQLAVEEANRRGGYKGLPYELVVKDDIGPWGSTSNKMVELNDAKVWCVLGSIDGQNTHIAIRVGLKLELMTLTSGSTDPTLTETRIPWYARINGDDRQISYALAMYMFKQKGYKRVAVLRTNNRYARIGSGEFRDAARRLNRPIVVEARFKQGARDFRTQIQMIKKYNPDAILLFADADDAAAAIKQVRRMGIRLPVYGGDRMAGDDFLKAAGPAAEGLIVVNFWNPYRKDAKLAQFYANYQKRFNDAADSRAAHAYDGMNLIIESVNKAGLNRALIRDYITSLSTWTGITGTAIFDPTWNDVGPVYMAQIRKGRFVYFAESQNGRIKPMTATPVASR